MSLEELNGLDRYLTGMEDACRMMRKNLAAKQISIFKGDDENSTSVMSNDGSSNLFPRDTFAGIDMSTQSLANSYPGAPVKEENRSEYSTRSSASLVRSGRGSRKKQKMSKVIMPKGKQIRDWDQKLYQVLNGKELTGLDMFHQLHSQKLLRFKGSDQEQKMYHRFRKILTRFEKKGLIAQASAQYNAPWHWIGGALMVGYRRKNENEKPEMES